MAGHNGRIAGTHEFFRFADEGQEEVYLGVVDVAGVPCEHYQSIISTAGGQGGGGESSMTLDYYFSAPWWSLPEAHASRVPVLLNLSGYYMRGPENRHDFWHMYEFGHFRVGVPYGGDGLFKVPQTAGTCVGNVTAETVPYAPAMDEASSCDADGTADRRARGGGGGDGGGLGGGLVFFLCLLSGLVGVALTLIFLDCCRSSKKPAAPIVSSMQMASMQPSEGSRA